MMNKMLALALFTIGLVNQSLQASTCPDPNNSSLQWGEIPAPWQANPYSAHKPQGEINTQFVRANILVAGLGRGAVCVYRNSLGDYSIWWPVLVKIPVRVDYNWIDTLGGFVCTQSLAGCQFVTAES
jgi:hypothetical protein